MEEEESGLRPFRTEFGSVVRRVRALRCCCGALVKYTTLANEPPICITADQQRFNLEGREESSRRRQCAKCTRCTLGGRCRSSPVLRLLRRRSRLLEYRRAESSSVEASVGPPSLQEQPMNESEEGWCRRLGSSGWTRSQGRRGSCVDAGERLYDVASYEKAFAYPGLFRRSSAKWGSRFVRLGLERCLLPLAPVASAASVTAPRREPVAELRPGRGVSGGR